MTVGQESMRTPGSVPVIGAPIRVLIAEDEANLGTILEQFMLARGFAVTIVRNGRAALDALRADRYDVALLDIVMPEMDGLEVLRQLRSEPLPPEVVVITGNGTMETALAAMKLGAYDFLSKPYRMAEIEALVRRAWEKRVLTRNNAALVAELDRAEPQPVIDSHFAPMRAVVSLIERVAPSDSPVLVTGEAGTGKESLARYIHARSHRASDPFVVVDAASDVIAALQGGQSPGADATAASGASLVDVAASGTLYLQRVEALSRDAQHVLLEALVRGYVPSASGTRRIPWSARVVASSSLDDDALARVIDEPLLQLLGTVRVLLPALRERLVDLRLLAERLLARSGARPRLSPEALALLEEYSWPGNVSELRLVLERAALLAAGDTIEPRHLALGSHAAPATPGMTPDGDEGTLLDLAGLERRHIAYVLEHTGWHQGKAAVLLGISPKTLYRKIREYGFRRPGSRRT